MYAIRSYYGIERGECGGTRNIELPVQTDRLERPEFEACVGVAVAFGEQMLAVSGQSYNFV